MDAAQQGTLLSVCQAVQFRLPPSCTILFGSSRLLQICPDFELWPHSQHHLDSVNRDQLPRSDLIAHAPTQDTDKSSASHHCSFKGNDQVDSRLALATLATSEQEEPAFVRPGMATFTY